jgi:hypothetical protein
MPPIQVEFPGMEESCKRSLHEFMTPFFTGVDRVIGGNPVYFPEATVEVVRNEKETTKPKIVLVVYGATEVERHKCTVTTDAGNKLGFEIWSDVTAYLYVRVTPDASDPKKNLRELIRTWAALVALFNCKKADLADRNIFNTKIPTNPEELSDEPVMLTIGEAFNFQIRARFACDDRTV